MIARPKHPGGDHDESSGTAAVLTPIDEDRTEGNLAYRRELERALGLPVNDLDREAGADLSEVVDFEATNRRELADQAAGARPGRTDHPEDGSMVAKVRATNRRKDCYRAAARLNADVVYVPLSGPVVTVHEDGKEVGSWVNCRRKANNVSPFQAVYITAAAADAGVLP